ncbi:MAG: VapC toxin family PIN domain ribonuclease [Deltaproteobacteria bacterium]|nr:VapC toxin family PIN domain ribonuclease [Deltaproteobacteria bacterium]
MILVDTSIWIGHLKGKAEAFPLSDLLKEEQVITHPWIIGELVMGDLGPRRNEFLSDVGKLQQLPSYDSEELRVFVDSEHLFGSGLSFVDVQLLYAAIQGNCRLWTRDKALKRMADRYSVAYGPI